MRRRAWIWFSKVAILTARGAVSLARREKNWMLTRCMCVAVLSVRGTWITGEISGCWGMATLFLGMKLFWKDERGKNYQTNRKKGDWNWPSPLDIWCVSVAAQRRVMSECMRHKDSEVDDLRCQKWGNWMRKCGEYRELWNRTKWTVDVKSCQRWIVCNGRVL